MGVFTSYNVYKILNLKTDLSITDKLFYSFTSAYGFVAYHCIIVPIIVAFPLGIIGLGAYLIYDGLTGGEINLTFLGISLIVLIGWMAYKTLKSKNEDQSPPLYTYALYPNTTSECHYLSRIPAEQLEGLTLAEIEDLLDDNSIDDSYPYNS